MLAIAAGDNRFFGAIATPGQIDTYTLNVSEPTRLWFDTQAINAQSPGVLQWSVQGSQGVVGKSADYMAFYGDVLLGSPSDSFGVNVPGTAIFPSSPVVPAGTYTVSVFGNGLSTGSYQFRILDLSKAASLPLDTSVAFNLPTPDGSNAYQFNVRAGDSYTFAMESNPNGVRWQLVDSYGKGPTYTDSYGNSGTFGGSGSSSGVTDGAGTVKTVTFAADGTYTLVLDGLQTAASSAGSFRVHAASYTPPSPPAILPQPLVLGVPQTSNLDPTGVASYTFTLTSAARLWFDSRTHSDSLRWSLRGPQGDLSPYPTPFSSDDASLGLLPAGTYTLQISGMAGDPFAFNLLDLASATNVTLKTSSDPLPSADVLLDPGNSASIYSFTATAGTRVAVDVQNFVSSNYYPGKWILLGPSGKPVSFERLDTGTSAALTLGVSGTYSVVLSGYITATAPTSESLFIRNLVTTTTPLPLSASVSGNVVSGTILRSDEPQSYAFDLSAATRLWFDSRASSSVVSWTLTGPQGASIRDWNGRPFFSKFSSGDLSLGVLPAGHYVLTVRSDVPVPTDGGYAFCIRNIDSGINDTLSLVSLADVTGDLPSADDTKVFAFSGSAGDQVTFDHLAWSAGPGLWTLVGPAGNVVFSSQSTNDQVIALRATGSYRFMVTGPSTTDPANGFGFRASLTGQNAPVGIPLTIGQTISGTLDASEHATYSWTVLPTVTPMQLWIDSLWASSYGTDWSLDRPQGPRVFVGTAELIYNNDENLGWNSADPSLFDQSVIASPAGIYTLTINHGAGASYAFRVIDASVAPLLRFDDTDVAQPVPPNGTQFFRVSGKAGDVFAIGKTLKTGTFYLYDQYGNLVRAVGSWDDSARFTLPSDGTYLLRFSLTVGDEISGSPLPLKTRLIHDNDLQLWGTTGDDAIGLTLMPDSRIEVSLNGYVMGTIAGDTPLTIVGKGGSDTVTVTGTPVDGLCASPSSIRVGTAPVNLDGIGVVSFNSSLSQSLTTTYGTPSGVASVPIAASDLVGDLVASAPTHFEVSADGLTFGATATFGSWSPGSPPTLYVRLKAKADAGTWSNEYVGLTTTPPSATSVRVMLGAGTVNAKNLTIRDARAEDKIYDGTARTLLTYSLATYDGLVNGDVFAPGTYVIPGGPTAMFQSVGSVAAKDVLNNEEPKPVTITGFLPPTGNYTVTQPTGLTAKITRRSLTISGVHASDRPYDGTALAQLGFALAAYSTLAPGDEGLSPLSHVEAGGPLGTFQAVGGVAAKDVLNSGDAKPVVATGFLPPNNNYTVSQPAGLSARILLKSLTVTVSSDFAAKDKVYDGNANADVILTSAKFVGLVPSDGLSDNAGRPSAIFRDGFPGPGKDVGANKPIQVSFAAPSSNYSVGQPSVFLRASITRKDLVVTADNKWKYWGRHAPAFTASVTGLVGSETAPTDLTNGITCTTNASPSSPPGVYSITPAIGSSGVDFGNYTVTTLVPGVFLIESPPWVTDLVDVAAWDWNSMSLKWSPPGPGGLPVLTYQVEYSSNGGVTWTTFPHANSTNTSIIVTGLATGTAYTFRITPIRSDGTSDIGNVIMTGPATTQDPNQVVVQVGPGLEVADSSTRSGQISLVKRGAGTLDLDRANTHSGGTTVEEGTVIVRNVLGLGSGPIRVKAGARLVIDVGGQNLTISSLNIEAGGYLDVGTSRVSIGSGASAASIRNLIQAAMGDGLWQTNVGIGSAAVAASVGQPSPRTIGWLDNGDGSYLVGYAVAGDTNLDGLVDVLDAANFLAGGKYDLGQDTSWVEGDFNFDGMLDVLDTADFLSAGLFDQGSYGEAGIPATDAATRTTLGAGDATDASLMNAAFAMYAPDSQAASKKKIIAATGS